MKIENSEQRSGACTYSKVCSNNDTFSVDLQIEENYLTMLLHLLKWPRVKSPLNDWMLIFFAGWLIPCILSYYNGVLFPSKGVGNKCFLFDLTMLSVFVIGIPLIVIAEPKVASALNYTLKHGMKIRVFTIPPQKLNALVEAVNCRAKSFKIHLLAISLAYVLSSLWMLTILTDHISTWHGGPQTPGNSWITAPGLYFWLVPFPAALYLFISWGLKYYLFLGLLRNITKYNIEISPLHPDKCGGLSFVGRASLAWGFIIVAIGFCVVFDFINCVYIQGASATRWDLILKMTAYIVLGPAFLFMQNLFFVRHLYLARLRCLDQLSELGTILSNEQYKRITKGLPTNEETPGNEFRDRHDEMLAVESAYKAVRSMRLWPFDTRTLTSYALMVASPLTSLILPHMTNWLKTFTNSP